MASRNPTLLVLALGLTLTACATGGASTSAPASSLVAVADPQRHGGPQRQRHGEPDGRACPDLPGEYLGCPG